MTGMRLLEPGATRVDVTETRAGDGIFRRAVTISGAKELRLLEDADLQACQTQTSACYMSNKRWSLVERKGRKIVATYDVRSDVVFNGSTPIGCLSPTLSAFIAEKLSDVDLVRVNPLELIGFE